MKFGIPKGTLFKTVIWSTIRMCKNNQNVWSIPTQFEKIFLLFSIFQKWTNDDQRITLSRIKLLMNFQTFLTLLLCSTVKPLKVCNIKQNKNYSSKLYSNSDHNFFKKASQNRWNASQKSKKISHAALLLRSCWNL